MFLVSPLALLSSLAGWALMVVTAMHLFSGPYDDRTCLTDCVSTWFWAAVAVGALALLLGLIGVFRANGRGLAIVALLFAIPLAGVFGTLIGIGNFYH